MAKTTVTAARLAGIATLCALAASCSTTEYAKVQTVVPTAKPSAEEVAMLNQLSTVDTSGQVATATAPIPLQPVDFATDTDVAMAYAVPAPKPLLDGQTAIDAQAGLSQLPGTTTTAVAMVPQVTQEMPLTYNDSKVAALAETTPATRSIDPFVTQTKNPDLNRLIAKYAAEYEVPERLVHRVVKRESNYNPGAVHRGNWGLMQIRYNTAKGMGYDGTANGLLDAETNLKYAVKYLRGAWLVADRNEDHADWLYRTGYYYKAKAKGLLEETGLK